MYHAPFKKASIPLCKTDGLKPPVSNDAISHNTVTHLDA
ncbi:hypothetical protein B4073_0863 [Bacillus subtilis]|nr:hypothetical protein MY9_0979 [Bacillus sp. JS]KIN32008.1 hypothetical protein B4068_0874 [Bacillus subtilis]KIN46165.1 hypothetical protein B4073_0863 [Bacillus subtilis]BAI84410.1 hypothetical protein BSNT_07295 [Bacillus subtilis subsp. natto BEST195]GAK82207.1 hypothetical protein BSMD_041540 [Bacillus subtilis Miyagi-4]